jgi:hypothetical protein
VWRVVRVWGRSGEFRKKICTGRDRGRDGDLTALSDIVMKCTCSEYTLMECA